MDISQRKALALECSFCEIAGVGAFWFDIADRVLHWSPLAAKLHGLGDAPRTPEELFQLYEGSSGELLRQAWLAAEEGGTSFDVEVSYGERWLSLKGKVVEPSTSPLLLGCVQDISRERATATELQKVSETKSAFLAHMSHELRTPLNAVIGLTSLLLDSELDEDQRDLSESVRHSGEALLMLVNDILDLSRVEAGAIALETMVFDLRDCIEESLELVAIQASVKELDLVQFVDSDISHKIYGDPTRLRQILLNLLSNSVKFTERGWVRIDCRVVGSDSRSQEIELTVRDTGPGINEQLMKALFRPFSQGDASVNRRFGGTGLGLTISKKLIELMGGTISVSTEVGVGTAFTLRWRAQIAPSSQRISLRDALLKPGCRALLVEDRPVRHEFIKFQLEALGVELVSAETLEDAEKILASPGHFDFAVVETRLAHGMGIRVAEFLRSPEGRPGLPILLLAPLGTQEGSTKDRGVRLAFPIKVRQLHTTVLSLIEGTAPQTQQPGGAKVQGALKDKNLRILLAEDNVTNQKVALRLLSSLGCRADLANNGLEALTAVQQQHYDVVFMDMQMPEMDGIAATQAIRKLEGPQPYIVALTAHAIEGERERCLRAGMDEYLRKPVRMGELETVLLELSEQIPRPLKS